jgi:predicted DNA-binding transcriptional regulator YafY
MLGEKVENSWGSPFEGEVKRKVRRVLEKCAETGQSVEIQYLSKNTNARNPRWRRISPHTICFDGFRPFIRAYCYDSATFKDFVLSRCLNTRAARAHDYVTSHDDALWAEIVTLTIGANPRLERDQRRAVAYQHLQGRPRLRLQVRRAFLPYLLRRLRLETLKSPSGRRLQAFVLDTKPSSRRTMSGSHAPFRLVK